jgi:hypothetical protein
MQLGIWLHTLSLRETLIHWAASFFQLIHFEDGKPIEDRNTEETSKYDPKAEITNQ